MKFFEALVFLFKGMLFLDGHLTAGGVDGERERTPGNDCSAAGCG